MRFFEELEIGARRELGSFTFSAEAIRKFATQFDPQAFHLDEEAGRRSLFGGFAASGCHVGSVCIKLLVADGQRLMLRWIRPVLAGDTISFSSVIETKRTSEKRPEWGIMQARTTGANQRGEPVYSFLATGFVPRRNAGA